MISNSIVTANDTGFSQAGVKVDYTTQKIVIKGRQYHVDAVQRIESKKVSNFSTEIKIMVDDFSKPVHKIGVVGIGNEGEKFIQRLCAALRKAGGPSIN